MTEGVFIDELKRKALLARGGVSLETYSKESHYTRAEGVLRQSDRSFYRRSGRVSSYNELKEEVLE